MLESFKHFFLRLIFLIAPYFADESSYREEYKRVVGNLAQEVMFQKAGSFEPAFPDYTTNNKTILGIDVNKNGIRDDLEIWINRRFSSELEKRALRQFAKGRRKMLSIAENKDKQTYDSILSAHVEQESAFQCLTIISRSMNVYNKDHWYRDFNAIHLNSYEREEAQNYFFNLLMKLPNKKNNAIFLRLSKNDTIEKNRKECELLTVK